MSYASMIGKDRDTKREKRVFRFKKGQESRLMALARVQLTAAVTVIVPNVDTAANVKTTMIESKKWD